MKIKKITPLLNISFFASLLFWGQVSFAQATPPLEVKNVSATPGNREVSLQWEQATDEDGVVVGYKIYYGTASVQSPEDAYEEYISVSTKTDYTVKNLQNGTAYFFAITAIDDEENESETYSKEVSATPETQSPAVVSAVQISNVEVSVNLSKPVKLQGGASSFYFEEIDTGREIPISNAVAEGDTVKLIIPSGSLDFGKNYKIMATSLVEDLSGNPIRSGITDSAEFKAIFFDDNTPSSTEIKATVPEQEAPQENSEINSGAPNSYNAAPSDSVVPLDASLLKVDSSLLKTEEMVVLSWQPAPDLDNDIADQVLFIQKGMNGWDDGISIGKYTNKIEVDVKLNQNYQVKILTVDTSGNESKGVQLSFSTNLVDTGSSTRIMILVLVLSLGIVGVFFGRRKTI